MTQSCFSLSQN